jgi:hypothetical protein
MDSLVTKLSVTRMEGEGLRISMAACALAIILVGCGGAAAPSIQFSASSSPTRDAIAAPTASATSAPQATATPLPTLSPMPATPPPLPKAVAITRKGCYTGPDPDGVPPGICTTTLTWKKVPTEGTEIEVYGVTRCLSQTKRAGDGSCLVVGAAVPTSARKLIARVPASKGMVSWTGPAWQDVIDTGTGAPRNQAIGVDRHEDAIYFAIIVSASNEAGHSKFVIADAGTWCYDTGCEGP